MKIKHGLQNLIGNNKVEIALKYLAELLDSVTEDSEEKRQADQILDEVIVLQAKTNHLKEQVSKGIISNEQATIEHAIITNSSLEILDSISKSIELNKFLEETKLDLPIETNHFEISKNNKINKSVYLFIGICALILISIVVIIIKPGKSDFNGPKGGPALDTVMVENFSNNAAEEDTISKIKQSEKNSNGEFRNKQTVRDKADNNGILEESITRKDQPSTAKEGPNPKNQQPEINGMLAYYSCDANANDLSGNSNDAILSAIQSTENKGGNVNSAFRFDGKNSMLTIPGNSLSASKEISISVWVLIDDFSTMFPGIIENFGGNSGYLLNIGKDQHFRFFIGKGDENYLAVRSQTLLESGVWYHVVGTYNNNNIKLYINGKLEDAKAFDNGMNIISKNPVLIGNDNCCGTSRHFKGKMDEIRIFDRALTTSEINKLYASNY
jgi:hypothetical protein